MSCCQTPLSLAYLRDLLSRRHDIAVYPSDALDREVPPYDVYFYRPTEILVPVEQVGLLLAAAREIGVRIRPICSDEPCGCGDDDRTGGERGSDDRDRDTDEGSDGGFGPALAGRVARFTVSTAVELDIVLDRLERAARALMRYPDSDRTEEFVRIERPTFTPNHVLFAAPLWGMSPFGEPRVAAAPANPVKASVGDGPVVAVIDSGLPTGYGANALLAPVDTDPSEEEGWSYHASGQVLSGSQGHGSFVAGVIRQVAPNAIVRSYMALDQDGVTDEWFLGTQVDLALGAAVINLSLGSTTRHDESLLGLGRLAEAAGSPGGPIVVAAAGNGGGSAPFWPAAEKWAIGVGAAQVQDGMVPARAAFSNFGAWVDVYARGVDVHSAYEANAYRYADGTLTQFEGGAKWDGTSFAAPWVAGRAAGLLAQTEGLTPAQIVAALGVPVPHLGLFVP